ncbi:MULTISPECIES: GNAT family N-acetyltransferase [unclassified Carboxylicivirga]|uniref:GNAT family N-acetyltransferase n=1 Tax=Carboxylicivirga TaxID=1628153 RepID=UPI003D35228E
MIKYLEWDSHFFKKKIGSCKVSILTEATLIDLFHEKTNKNYDLIYLFTQETDKKAKKTLEERYIKIIDKKVTYITHHISTSNQPTDFIIHYNGIISEELLQLTYLSGHESRFKKDPILNEKFEALYQQWIEKSLRGQMADSVFVASIDNHIRGFVTVKKNSNMGQIGLIAVDPSYHGQGIGGALIKAAHKWYAKNGITQASVVTQLDNTGACKLYTKSGYNVAHTQLIYHI